MKFYIYLFTIINLIKLIKCEKTISSLNKIEIETQNHLNYKTKLEMKFMVKN